MDSCLNFDISRLTEPIEFEVSRLTEPIEFEISFICAVNKDRYLKVTPDIIWLTPDNNFSEDVEVHANVNWTITVGDEAEEIQLIANDTFIANDTYITNGEPIAPNVIELLENSTLIHNETMIQR